MKCEVCHNDIHASKLEDLIVIDERFVCQNCANNLFVCKVCGKHFDKDNIIVTDGFEKLGFCLSCLKREKIYIKRCHRCNKNYIYEHQNFRITLPLMELAVISFASMCHPELYCADCERYVCRYGNCTNFSTFGHHFCEHHVPIEKIKEYGYKPECNFYKLSNEENDLYIGVEFEINFDEQDDLVKFLSNVNSDFFYFKHDGSIGSYGVEIVSHPADIQYHINSKEWEKLFIELNKYKTNTKGCGIHFHISKDALNQNIIRNIDFFVNNFDKEIAKIGSRFYNDYAQKRDNFERIYRHYDACNLSNNKTIELRFCASTHNYKTFMNKLKNIFIILMYCYNHNVDAVDYYGFNQYKQDMMSRI